MYKISIPHLSKTKLADIKAQLFESLHFITEICFFHVSLLSIKTSILTRSPITVEHVGIISKKAYLIFLTLQIIVYVENN